MDKLEQLKEQLKALSPEEIGQLKAFLNADSGEETKTEDGTVSNIVKDETPKSEETKPVETNKDAPVVESKEEIPVNPTPTEDKAGEVATPTEEEKSEPVVEETPIEEPKVEEQVSPTPTKDEGIPKMQKGIQESEDEEVESAPKITAETGEELPIDYEQIIEAQNAKIAALQAENSSLKNKVEGAFGYSSKPAISTKVNRLYDDATDVHFHK